MQVSFIHDVNIFRLIYILIARKCYPEDIEDEIQQPNFTSLIQKFLWDQQHDDSQSNSSLPPLNLPTFYEKITTYPSALSVFRAPSDLSGVGGMRRERIRAVKVWRKGPPRYDTMFINADSNVMGMRGLEVARARLFFSFSSDGEKYPCALVHWYSHVGEGPDDSTGMWLVEPDICPDGSHNASVIHLDAIMRASHLMPLHCDKPVDPALNYTDTLDTFPYFYVNKYLDHHAFEVAF